jgi:hypothetical protein
VTDDEKKVIKEIINKIKKPCPCSCTDVKGIKSQWPIGVCFSTLGGFKTLIGTTFCVLSACLILSCLIHQASVFIKMMLFDPEVD